jgi:predicted house-cleaning noncanonical NTP pyrophosphatase (MazG superfamily)
MQILKQPKTLNRLFIEVSSWLTVLAKNGPNLFEHAHLKTVDEAKEFSENPTLEEAADVLICVAAVIAREGWYPWELAEAMDRKLQINRTRTWHQTADGTWQHDEETND